MFGGGDNSNKAKAKFFCDLENQPIGPRPTDKNSEFANRKAQIDAIATQVEDNNHQKLLQNSVFRQYLFLDFLKIENLPEYLPKITIDKVCRFTNSFIQKLVIRRKLPFAMIVDLSETDYEKIKVSVNKILSGEVKLEDLLEKKPSPEVERGSNIGVFGRNS